MAGFMTVTSAFEGVMYIIVLVMGGVLILNGSMLASDMIVFIMYINMLITSLKRIIQFTENFQKGLTGIQRFHEVMTAKPRVIDSSHPIELEDVAGRIEARHLVFDYHNGERVLDDINFTIEPGQQVAFVGPSGAGKSTLINLIPRFYDLTSGEILVDGHNIQDISLFSLRDHIGIVQQDVYLFAGTIADNIRYGKLDASDAEIRQAADLAGLLALSVNYQKASTPILGKEGPGYQADKNKEFPLPGSS